MSENESFGPEAKNEAVQEAERIFEETKNQSQLKDKAIQRHYDVVVGPTSSEVEADKSRHALGILSRDTGKPIIIRFIDKILRRQRFEELNNTKEKIAIDKQIINNDPTKKIQSNEKF